MNNVPFCRFQFGLLSSEQAFFFLSFFFFYLRRVLTSPNMLIFLSPHALMTTSCSNCGALDPCCLAVLTKYCYRHKYLGLIAGHTTASKRFHIFDIYFDPFFSHLGAAIGDVFNILPPSYRWFRFRIRGPSEMSGGSG
jgi:hypothetical protein